MRFFRGLAEGKGFPGEPAPIPPLAAAARASCAALMVGPLRKTGEWVTGGLNRSQAHSLDMAILVVGLPPVFFFVAIAWFVYRRRQTWRGEAEAEGASSSDSASSR